MKIRTKRKHTLKVSARELASLRYGLYLSLAESEAALIGDPNLDARYVELHTLYSQIKEVTDNG